MSCLTILVPAVHFSSPFQEELTHWLRMALQTNPDKRGGERDEFSGDAVCLMRMDHVLRTRVSDQQREGERAKERETDRQTDRDRDIETER